MREQGLNVHMPGFLDFIDYQTWHRGLCSKDSYLLCGCNIAPAMPASPLSRTLVLARGTTAEVKNIELEVLIDLSHQNTY